MLRSLFIRWVVVFLAVLLAGYIVPDLIHFASPTEVAVFAIILALLNAFIRPLLVLFTLPITLVTLGLFLLIINALLFWLAGALVPGVDVNGFLGALVGAIIVSVVSFVMNRAVR